MIQTVLHSSNFADRNHRAPSSQTFRPDIEGLRGLAILLVVFYHLEKAGFSGGYVGVDVFLRPVRLSDYWTVAKGDRDDGALKWAGLLLLVGATVLFNGQTLFPGVAAVVPVLGTVTIP